MVDDAFWLRYLRAHADPRTRRLHVAGTTVATGVLLAAVARRDLRLAAAALACGYGPAWFAHGSSSPTGRDVQRSAAIAGRRLSYVVRRAAARARSRTRAGRRRVNVPAEHKKVARSLERATVDLRL